MHNLAFTIGGVTTSERFDIQLHKPSCSIARSHQRRNQRALFAPDATGFYSGPNSLASLLGASDGLVHTFSCRIFLAQRRRPVQVARIGECHWIGPRQSQQSECGLSRLAQNLSVVDRQHCALRRSLALQ